MKLSKLSITFALVVSVHVAVLGFILLQPGCKSTKEPVIVGQDTTVPATGAMQAPSDLNPAPVVPEYQPPTRPNWTETPEAAAPVAQTELLPVPSQVGTYKVQRGDSLSKIASKHGVSVAELAAANNMKLSDTLRVGQSLVIPAGATVQPQTTAAAAPVMEPVSAPQGETTSYTVQRGDSLSKIATQHRTTVAAIQRLNNLSGTVIRVGQKLVIPSGGASAPTASAAAAPTTGDVHIIASGETLGSVAAKHGVKLADLQAVNPGVDSRRLRIGQKINLPKGAVTPAPQAPAAPAAAAPAPEAPKAPEAPAAPAAPAPAQPVVEEAPVVVEVVEEEAAVAPVVPVETL